MLIKNSKYGNVNDVQDTMNIREKEQKYEILVEL